MTQIQKKDTGKRQKEAGQANVVKSREYMTNKAISELYLKELITKEQEPSARTLYRSCLQSYQRPKDKTKKSYEKVGFNFESPIDMAIKFITRLPIEWEKWQEQQKIYDGRDIEEDTRNRPSIDRINSNGHYSIDNIQTDSLEGNYTDASNRRRVKTPIVMIDQNGSLAFQVYESQTEAKNELNMNSNSLKKIQTNVCEVIYKDSEGNKHASGKQTVPMNYIELKPKDEEDLKRLSKEHGLTYETPEVRAIRDAKAIEEMIRNGQLK